MNIFRNFPRLICLLLFFSFGKETRPTQDEIVKRVNKATQSLWTQTGATLEHVVLWWCSTPLACQPVAASRHLRDWLLNMQYDGVLYFQQC